MLKRSKHGVEQEVWNLVVAMDWTERLRGGWNTSVMAMTDMGTRAREVGSDFFGNGNDQMKGL